MKKGKCAQTAGARMGILFVLFAMPAMAQTQCFTPSVSTDVLDWLAQHVCSVSGVVQNIDPCSCPTSGGSLPRLTVGENLPYHKWTQPDPNFGNLPRVRHDSFPARDVNGNNRVVNTEGRNSNLNGYTVYRSDNLSANPGWSSFPSGYWASSNGTKDSAGLSTSLWGCPVAGGNSLNCLPYGGWLHFPSTLLQEIQSGGGTSRTVQWWMLARHWEQDSQYFPGAIPEATVYPENTSVALTNLVYGGPSTSTQKIIAHSVRGLHGYNPAVVDWVSTGHVEALYFTQLYGFTRWEGWHPVQQWDSTIQANAQAAALVCDAMIGTYNTSGTYQGTITTTFPGIPSTGAPYTMVMTACADYTNVTTTGEAGPPAWPVPELNLLSNPHFTVANPGGIGGWGGADSTGWNTAGSPTFSVQTSAFATDTALCDTDGGAPNCGVNYATLQAGSNGTNYVCAGSTTGTCSLYSNIALPSGMTAGNTYWIDFGAFAGIDAGSPVLSGQLKFVVDQLICNPGCSFITGASVSAGPYTYSNIISSSEVLDSILQPSQCVANCGTSNEIDVAKPQQITIAAGATNLRLAIWFQPQNGVIFDVPQAWLQYLPVN